MTRKQALSEYFGYEGTLVLRDGSVHSISLADLSHSEDSSWRVKLILYPPESNLCPGSLSEASGFISGLKSSHVDVYSLLESDLAISVYDLPEDPYR